MSRRVRRILVDLPQSWVMLALRSLLLTFLVVSTQHWTVVAWDEPNPPSWGLDRLDQWGFHNQTSWSNTLISYLVGSPLNVDQNYHYEFTGQGVLVFVLDTGIRSTHTDFGLTTPFTRGSSRVTECWNYIDQSDPTCRDDHGQGTFTAALIGGTIYGVAKQVQLINVKVLDQQGRLPSNSLVQEALQDIQKYKKNHSDVPMVVYLGFSLSSRSGALNDAVESLVNEGQVTVVVPAGNHLGRPACQVSPASATGAVTVGATQAQDARYWKSNIGTCVDLFAPGQGIVSAGFKSDTSQAAPQDGTALSAAYVAGVVALVLEQHPTWTPSQVRDTLLQEAAPGRIRNVGQGSPNLLATTFYRTRTALTETLRLEPTEISESAQFGLSLALINQTLLVGAPIAPWNDTHRDGAVYVYEKDEVGNWTLQTKIVSSDPQPYHNFGWNLAWDGDTLLVGAPFDTDRGEQAGSVYVFSYHVLNHTWMQQVELYASDPAPYFRFGDSIAVNGNVLVVGSPRHDSNRDGYAEGAVYVFVRENSSEASSWREHTLLSSSPNATLYLTNFGTSVALNGNDVLVVNAYRYDESDNQGAAVYIFLRDHEQDAWLLHQTYMPINTALNSFIGLGMAMRQGTLVLGAVGDNPNGYQSGSCFVLERLNSTNQTSFWEPSAYLVASSSTANARFGSAISMSASATAFVVSAPFDSNPNGFFAGAAYIYVREDAPSPTRKSRRRLQDMASSYGTTWEEVVKLLPSDGRPYEQFGMSVSLDGPIAVVGVPYATVNGTDFAGAVYIYDWTS